MQRENLFGGPPATYLLEEQEPAAELRAGEEPAKVAARFPSHSAAWAALSKSTAPSSSVSAASSSSPGSAPLDRAAWRSAASRASSSAT